MEGPSPGESPLPPLSAGAAFFRSGGCRSLRRPSTCGKGGGLAGGAGEGAPGEADRLPEPAGGASVVAPPLFEPPGGEVSAFGACGVLGAGGLAFANESLRALRRASTSASSNLTRNDEMRSWMMLSARLYRMPPAPTVSRSDSISMMTPRS